MTEKLERHRLSVQLQNELSNLSGLLPYHVDKIDKLLSRVQSAPNSEHTSHKALSPDQIAGLWLRENATLFDADRTRFLHYANGSSAVFNRYSLPFDFDKLNIKRQEKVGLANLLACKAAPECALLISGPNGSGKTAVARQLGMHFNMPVLTRSLADMLSWQPGETERNLRTTFRMAAEESVILLLEDIDTYGLRFEAIDFGGKDIHKNAQETLSKCLSEHRGLVIATACEPQVIDEHIAQRFGCRLTLTYLTKDQNQALFEELCATAVFDQRPLIKASLETMKLVPDDYVHALKAMRLHAMGLAEASKEQDDADIARPAGHGIDPRQLLNLLKAQHAARHIASV